MKAIYLQKFRWTSHIFVECPSCLFPSPGLPAIQSTTGDMEGPGEVSLQGVADLLEIPTGRCVSWLIKYLKKLMFILARSSNIC